jgi:hypothetical protein
VLERALVAREESGKMGKGRMLGEAAGREEEEREYEVWVERVREGMDEETEDEEEDAEEDEEDEDEDGEEEG